MIEDKYDNVWHQHYTSVNEFLNLLPSEENKHIIDENVYHRADDVSWWGWSGGFKQFQKFLHHTWPDGNQWAQQHVHKDGIRLPVGTAMRRQRTRAAQGDSLDIHRVYAGSLETAWQSTKRVVSPSQQGLKNISIVVNLATVANVSWDDALWRGALAATLTDILQRSGRNVQVIIQNSVTNLLKEDRNKICCVSVVLKDYMHHMTFEQLLISCSVAMNRSHMFIAKAAFPVPVRDGMGAPSHSFLPRALKTNAHSVVHINGIFSQEDANEFLHKTLREKFQFDVDRTVFV